MCIDRAKQYAAIVFFNKSTQKYEVVGDFGGGVSTGKQNITDDKNLEMTDGQPQQAHMIYYH